MMSTLFCVILYGIMDGFEIIAVGLWSPPGRRRQKKQDNNSNKAWSERGQINITFKW